MLIADGGGDGTLPYPTGDPDALRTAASQLINAGHEVGSAKSSITTTASDLGAGWAGEAAKAFEGVATTVVNGLHTLGEAHGTAGTLLRGFAETLEEEQRKAKAAQHALDEAASTLSSALSAASTQADAASTSLASDAKSQAAAAAAAGTRATHAFDATKAAQTKIATDAFNAVQTAGNAVATRIDALTTTLAGLDYHGVVDIYNAIPTAFQGVAGIAVKSSVVDLAKAAKALRGKDADALIDAAKNGYKTVQTVVDDFGEDSPQALRAWIEFHYGAMGDLAKDGLKDLTGFDELPEGAGRALSILGKVGLVTAAAGDIMTLADGDASGADKGLAGVNLAGTGMAAVGLIGDESLVGTLIGAQALDVIPVAGEVVMAVTGAIIAGKYIYDHWDAISHGAETAFKDVGEAQQWLNNEEAKIGKDVLNGAVDEGKTLVAAGQTAVHAAGTVVDAAGSVVAKGASEVAHTGSSIVHGAASLASDLDPF